MDLVTSFQQKATKCNWYKMNYLDIILITEKGVKEIRLEEILLRKHLA